MNRAGVPGIHDSERIILYRVSLIIHAANLRQNCTNQPTKHEVPVVLFVWFVVDRLLSDMDRMPASDESCGQWCLVRDGNNATPEPA